ncbi:subtilisin-like protein [Lactarius akahatsu]|uniref:tripeptidyl-peptidase II n=1 Tax=Lactarius akahatsu TaxID=416441 RepID=A0AAD4LQS7_9AGAM|nr:subtilisin-like protein [Lactarius akahatsu]
MRFYPLSVLSIIAIGPLRGLATFAPRWDEVKAKHTWNSIPENWQNLGHPPSGTTIDLHIALKAQNENALIDVLYQVSSPGHPKYGAHLSREEVAELIAPPSDVLELANAWLEHHGIPPSAISTKHGGSWLTVIDVPVSRANELLSASYKLYRNVETNDTVLRTLSYGLPTALLEHVQNVAPTTHFGFPRTPRMRHDEAAGTQKRVPAGEPGTVYSSRQEPYVTPSFLRSLYKTSSYVPVAADRNALGVVGFLGDHPNPDDLKQFMNEYRFDATSATYTVAQIKGGGYDPGNPGVEANLNMQYTSAMAFPTRRIFYSTGKADTGDSFINWLNYALDLLRVPQTVSTPYSLPEDTIPLDYATHLCNLYAQLGVRGASVLFSSGNNGVGRGNCMTSDSSGNSRVQFRPTFPSTCPWVTSVGGTTGNDPEIAARFSGGGFSAYFPRPSYQDSAVPAFLQRLRRRYSGLYNPEGRGVPDIALQAMNFGIIFKTKFKSLDGTSCATPTAAGIISLLNDYRISNGKAPLGFLNPWLYGIGLEGLNDITSGSNPGCKTKGFSAVPGWDPITGLGSLDFEKLVATLSRW